MKNIKLIKGEVLQNINKFNANPFNIEHGKYIGLTEFKPIKHANFSHLGTATLHRNGEPEQNIIIAALKPHGLLFAVKEGDKQLELFDEFLETL